MAFGRLRRRVACPGGLAALVVVLALVASGCFSPGGSAVQRDGGGNPTSRDASAWPFASTSPWNHPIGTGAQYSAAGDAQTQAVTTAPATINSAVWSKPIVAASLSDPVRYLGSGGNAIQIHVPDSATPAGPPGGDQHLNIVDPSRHVVDESWKTGRVFANNLASGFHIRVDLRGDGLTGATASGMSSTAGVIRTWELQAHDIRHVLSICMPPDFMAVGPVWPARTQDSSAAAVYHGSVHMGALMAIPPSVSIPALGLSPEGAAIATALQRYGAYVIDKGGSMALYAEPSAQNLVNSARADMRRIQAQLRVVTNNSPSSVGGGGNWLAPPAPPFYN